MLTVTRAKADLVGRFVVGSLLLVPAAVTFGFACWLPVARTVGLSFETAVPGRPGQFAGLANYVGLWRDPALGPAFARSLLVALVRVLAVLPLPALVARLWGRQKPAWRLLARAVLALGLALSAPAGLGLLWRLAAPRTPWLRWLAADGSRELMSYLLLEFVSFLGAGGALAAIALLVTRRGTGRAARGILGLAAMAALASGLDAFSLPFVAASGAPTLSLHLFRTAFQRLRLGQAAAEAQPLLLLSLGLGLAFALLSEGVGLRLVPARPGPGRRSARWSFFGGALALALLVLPLVLLYLWGAGQAFLFPARPLAEAASTLQLVLALVNGNLARLLVVLLLQLPAAYLAALSLTLVRPFGHLGSRLARAVLIASGFVPQVVVGFGLFDVVRQAGLANTLLAGGVPLVAGPAGFYILELYFAGQAPVLARARTWGQSGAAVFFRHVFGPSLGVLALAGAVSLLVAGQSLLWPLLVLARSDLYPLSLQLVVHQMLLAETPAALAAGAWLVLTCWGAGMLALWWPLQALVLERVRLVARPQAPLTVSDGKKMAWGPW